MTQEPTFDEARVLRELEQLQLAIQATRAQRERVQAEFDAQLRAFEPATPPRSAAPPPLPTANPSGQIALAPSESAAGRVVDREPAVSRLFDREPAEVVEPEAIAADEAVPRRSSFRLLALVGGATLFLSFGLVWMFNRTPNTGTQPAAQYQPRPVPPLPSVAEPSKPPAPPVDPHLVRVDLKTLRRVWLRVSVDGRIAIEREVAAGEQLPFGADRSIVVRAGDAGAVTASVGGLDQGPMGRDGEVMTRTFTAPVR